MPQENDFPMPNFRKEKYVWLRSQLEVDQLNIDSDLMEIPVLLQEVGEMASFAIEIKDSSKEALETAKAEVADELRRTPDENGKTRSESTITSMIPLSPKYKSRLAELSEARLDASLWQSLSNAMQRKDSAIRVTADLITSAYISRDYIVGKRRSEIRKA